jgi:putative flippase GtrA
MAKSAISVAEIKRVGKFGLVGALNTIIDFTLYNLLHFWLGFGLIQANVVSTSTAMVFSFFTNKRLVFNRGEGSVPRQAVVFFVATAFGLYVLQNGVIIFLTEVWTTPIHLVVSVVHLLGLDKALSDTFVINNGVKAVATVVSMTWNYIIYKKVVFK